MGSDNVTNGTYLAVTDRCDAVWLYFPPDGGPPGEIIRVNMMDNKVPKKPDVYRDTTLWKTKPDKNGKQIPQDPVSLQYELPLIATDFDNRSIVFKSQH
jgi:hypothetical protein